MGACLNNTLPIPYTRPIIRQTGAAFLNTHRQLCCVHVYALLALLLVLLSDRKMRSLWGRWQHPGNGQLPNRKKCPVCAHKNATFKSTIQIFSRLLNERGETAGVKEKQCIFLCDVLVGYKFYGNHIKLVFLKYSRVDDRVRYKTPCDLYTPSILPPIAYMVFRAVYYFTVVSINKCRKKILSTWLV